MSTSSHWGCNILCVLYHLRLIELGTRHHALLPILLATFCLAIFAWMIRGVTVGGAAAGFVVTLVLSLAGGLAMFAAVVLVFVLTYIATKFRRSRKQALAIAERSAGRDAAQVFANLGAAALMAALAQLRQSYRYLMVASVAALAETVCDTVSSEAGKALARNPRLIVSWQPVSAGTDGAISLPGTFLGILAGALIGVQTVATHILTPQFALIAVCAGIIGMLVDSFLGATLERRGWLTNNAVNLASTTCSAVLAAMATSFVMA